MAVTQPELIVLPEMPVCEWIFVGDTVESVRRIVTANIALAEKKKSTYPRDLRRTDDT